MWNLTEIAEMKIEIEDNGRFELENSTVEIVEMWDFDEAERVEGYKLYSDGIPCGAYPTLTIAIKVAIKIDSRDFTDVTLPRGTLAKLRGKCST